MGWSRKRKGADGKIRYSAEYRDIRGVKRSAGTFASRKEADKAWQKAEVKATEGRATPVRRGAIRFEPYVRDTWFPNHPLELRSRENYSCYLEKHIIPWFGPMRMIEIGSPDVREFVTKLGNDKVPASSVQYCLTILSAIFTTALNDQVVFLHPCRGVSGPVVAKKIRAIITPEQFDTLRRALGEKTWQLLVETDIETGLRWGELTELRPKDLDAAVLTISRVVIELTAKFHPEGGHFLVKNYPKDKEHRQVSISKELDTKLRDLIAERGIGPDDLIFQLPQDVSRWQRPLAQEPELEKMEKFGGENGDQYTHGTLTGYVAGKCKCDDCRAKFAVYRRDRRADGKDQPRRQRTVNTDGHIPRNWFRNNVWLPARAAAKLGEGVKPHSLRHAHASWLLAGGADIARVKERLGHASILTTQKYLHTLPDLENDVALDAFAKIRNRSKPDGQSKKGRCA
ncbi:MAG TPA: site-specific integrase [Streptosporangiaceae bacterium]|nr:site-specific integrase [Streptosporangiaceae bacterium]